MNFKAIINAILIIFLLHLLLRNINFGKFDKKYAKKENFTTQENKSLKFLLDLPPVDSSNPSDTTNTCYDKLVDYVDKCTDSVKPGNYFIENENTANFKSNVLNVHKFYNRNEGSYDGLDAQQLSELIPKNYPEKQEENDPAFLKKIEDQTCFPKRDIRDNTQLVKPDNWNYKNELPMNGGQILNGIVGYDSLDDAYAIYSQNRTTVSPKCDTPVDCSKPADDIRCGLGYPNQVYRETR